MANNINWGKIYESTAWGSGVDDNTIGWGDSYADLAGGGPKNTIAPVISGTAERGETLTSTTGTWTGTGTITYAYQWKRNGADISGATASTYVLVVADDNANMTCVISATDTEGTKSATSNVLGPVLGSPFLLSSPVASGTAQVGQTLSTTDGTWQGVATITFAYQWRRDAVNISGATSSTYTLVAADYATDVDCVVTATNGLGSANADSNDLGPIAGTAPVISGVPTLSGTAKVGSTLTATAASVAGVPTPTTSWQWQRSDNGSTGWANISGATSSTYTAVSADETKYLRAVQTETNVIGSDSANSASSAQVAAAFTGLLDTYSGAAAAYSLRLLDSTYTGDAIVVRRASDNTTQSIGFVNNELDTASLESFCSGTDGFVTTWYDQSGNGNDAVNATAAEQPKIVSAGSTILENGKAAIEFDGGNDNLNTSAFEMTSAFSVFGAFNMSATSGYRALISHNFVSAGTAFLNQGRWILIRTGSAGQDWQGGDTALIGDGSSSSRYPRFISNGSVFSANTQYVVSGILSNATSQLWANGSASSARIQQTASITSETGKVYIGSSEIYDEFQGKIQEVMIWDIDQSSNRTGIETNINSHYNIYP